MSISELVINWMIAGFQLELAKDIQLSNPMPSFVLILFYHVGLYFLLHKLRIGFTFPAPSPTCPSKQGKYSRIWIYLGVALIFFHSILVMSVYNSSRLLIPSSLLCIATWAIILYMSYRREMED
ncbi:hypothetical protein WMW72_00670 [Paenibacillus filicis]|uniref:Uncharacterized protein n=1 Tax=Paenibacillus filicis TaxID=669464 RepID=A0ABU9DEG8_9BACL